MINRDSSKATKVWQPWFILNSSDTTHTLFHSPHPVCVYHWRQSPVLTLRPAHVLGPSKSETLQLQIMSKKEKETEPGSRSHSSGQAQSSECWSSLLSTNTQWSAPLSSTTAGGQGQGHKWPVRLCKSLLIKGRHFWCRNSSENIPGR